MKVRIVKCDGIRNDIWYKGQIGNILSVTPDLDNAEMYELSDYALLRIRRDDCEILEADEPKPEPFDLERALKGEKVVNNDGSIGEYKFTNNNGGGVLHVFQFSVNNGEDQAVMSFKEGAGWKHGYNGIDCGFSITMAPRAPEYQTVWVTLFDEKQSRFINTTEAYYNKEEAMKYNDISTIGTFPITFKKP